MKKYLSVLIAVVFTSAMSLSAFAASFFIKKYPNGCMAFSNTISNPF